MGIYSDGKIYGVSIRYTDIVLFERKYEVNLSIDQVNEIKEFYNNLSEEGRGDVSVYIYMAFLSTYSPSDKRLMSWVPSSRERLEALF